MSAGLQRTSRQIGLVSGLVLFAFAAIELCSDAVGLVSLQTMGDIASWQLAFTRSLPGLVVLSLAGLSHVLISIWFTIRRATLRMSIGDAFQILSGVLVPLLLLPYLVATRVANAQFGVDDDILYRLAKLWPEHSPVYVLLIVLLWSHGCVGLHRWLRLRPGYRSVAPILGVLALAVPIAAVAGLIAAARVVSVLMSDATFAGQVRATTHWPSENTEQILWRMQLGAVAAYGALLLLAIGAMTARFMKIVVAPKIDVAFVNGPKLKASMGPTLLEISRIHGVPLADSCGGRGRCTACSVRIEEGVASLAPRSAAEQDLLGNADANIRLACQIRPAASLTVTRLTQTSDAVVAEPEVDAGGVERQVATLSVQLQGHIGLIASRPAYDAVFFLNEFLDVLHTAVVKHKGAVMQTPAAGIIAVFGQDDTPQLACRAAFAAAADIEAALDRLNERFSEEFGQPIKIAAGLVFATAYIGRIGAGPTKSLMAIGPVVNAANSLAAIAEARGLQFLLDPAALRIAGIDANGMEAVSIALQNGATLEAFTSRNRLATFAPAAL